MADRGSKYPKQATGGNWVTINGAHVYIVKGRVAHGAPKIAGQDLRALRPNKDKGWEGQAQEAGVDVQEAHQLAGDILAHDQSFKDDRKEMLHHARQMSQKMGYGDLSSLKARIAKGDIDSDKVKGLDDVAAHLGYPEQFVGHEDNRLERLFELLEEGDPVPMSEDEAFTKAVEILHEHGGSKPPSGRVEGPTHQGGLFGDNEDAAEHIDKVVKEKPQTLDEIRQANWSRIEKQLGEYVREGYVSDDKTNDDGDPLYEVSEGSGEGNETELELMLDKPMTLEELRKKADGQTDKVMSELLKEGLISDEKTDADGEVIYEHTDTDAKKFEGGEKDEDEETNPDPESAFNELKYSAPMGMVSLDDMRKKTGLSKEQFDQKIQQLRRERKIRLVSTGSGRGGFGTSEGAWDAGIPGEGGEHYTHIEAGPNAGRSGLEPSKVKPSPLKERTKPKAPSAKRSSASIEKRIKKITDVRHKENRDLTETERSKLEKLYEEYEQAVEAEEEVPF